MIAVTATDSGSRLGLALSTSATTLLMPVAVFKPTPGVLALVVVEEVVG